MMQKLLNLFSKKQMGTGANVDIRPQVGREKDYYFGEIVATANPVNWIEKPKEQWRKFPIYNQNGSGSCFPRDAEVLIQDLSYKPIGEINIGDMVVTHKGNIKRVTEIFQRKWQGTTRLITLWGDYQPIEATLEHPFFAIKRTRGSQLKEIGGTPNFYKLEDLEKDDWVGLPLNDKIIKDTTIYDFEKDPEFLWVLGLYLAEGSIDKYCVVFSLHQKETAFVERIKKAMSKYDTNVTASDKTDSLAMQVKIQGRRWVDIFEELGSKICDKKEINKRLMFLAPELQMNIVQGYIDGDGHSVDDRTIIVSTSLKLLTQVKIILLRNRVYSFLQQRKEREDRKPVWVLEFSKTSRYSFVKDNWCFVLIKKVEHSPAFYGGHVYNLEVEDDNSYIVRGVAVHNCVAQTMAKLLGILYWLKNGAYVHFSATHVYQRRSNKPSGGMAGVDAFDIARNGVTLEELVLSQNMTDTQMDSYKIDNYKEKVGEIFSIPKYVQLPIRDIDTVASVIQTTQKAVMVWFYFKIDEWTERPFVKYPNLDVSAPDTLRHSITAVDYTLVNGKRALIVDDSWGSSYGLAGQRIIDEDFFRARNFFAAYPINFAFEDQTQPSPVPPSPAPTPTPGKPKYIFTQKLVFIPWDTANNQPVDTVLHENQKSDVKALQDILKFEGLFPANTDSSGYYGAISAKSVLSWQKKHVITSMEEIDGVGGKIIGPKSIVKLNELYGV